MDHETGDLAAAAVENPAGRLGSASQAPAVLHPTLDAGGLVRRILLVIFLLSLVGGAGGFYLVLRYRALQGAASEARLLLATTLAVSDYTDENTFPLLDKLPADRFYDQVVPFHVAQAVFRKVLPRDPAGKPLARGMHAVRCGGVSVLRGRCDDVQRRRRDEGALHADTPDPARRAAGRCRRATGACGDIPGRLGDRQADRRPDQPGPA